MYVCICKAVTDKKIKETVCAGVCTMRGLCETLGVARQCGRCGPVAREILNATLKELPQGQAITVHPRREVAA